MNYKEEALFMTLSGYAQNILENNDQSINGIPYTISKSISRHFRNKNKSYSKSDALKIIEVLKKWDKDFIHTETNPAILLVITLYYLLYESQHMKTRILFGQYGTDVKKMWDDVENSVYKDRLFQHLEFIEKFIY